MAMVQAGSSYPYYGYPYSWGRSTGTQYYAGSPPGSGYSGYSTYSGQPVMTPQRTVQRSKTSKTSKTSKEKQNKALIIAVAVLAILLLIAIILLITIGIILPQKDQTTGELSATTAAPTTTKPPTIIGFDVKRTDLPYGDELATSNTSFYSTTSILFCEMIANDWYAKAISTDICSCVKFQSGSVIASVRLAFPDGSKTPEEILADVKTIVTPKSTEDGRTDTVAEAGITLITA